jgi:hypothetical protein
MSLLGQRQNALPIPAQRQPLEEQGVNLPLQFASGPAGIDRLDLVEGPGLGLFHPKEQAVVSPGQFVTQCVTNWVVQIECPHLLKIGAVETPSKFIA